MIGQNPRMVCAVTASPEPHSIRPAREPGEITAVRELFLEYARWLGEDLCFQGFAGELAGLPGDYAPPRGRLFFAVAAGAGGSEPAGCIALRPFDADTGEVKRLYVRQAYRGCGLGLRLAELAIESARESGYRRLVLDTLARMDDAVRLYRRLGFGEIPAYYHNPIPGALYFGLQLAP